MLLDAKLFEEFGLTEIAEGIFTLEGCESFLTTREALVIILDKYDQLVKQNRELSRLAFDSSDFRL
ncbi:MAG: hypothetical protein MOGMAGMI_00377 [Candidatus Omnitrophica bacterium]|nr:hypothetical protein [Candidatus Omnitrophota bacterium]